MRKTAGLSLFLAAFFLAMFVSMPVFCQSDDTAGKSQETVTNEGGPAPIIVEEPAVGSFNANEYISRIKDAGSLEDALNACEDAIRHCSTYDDYEKLSDEIKKFVAMQRNYKYLDAVYYACAKTRLEELAYLAGKNDIDSGRIYMSVNEKYYNGALECLDKASLATKSKDLQMDIALIRFAVFKNIFQPQKAEAVFNDMVNRISSYGEDDQARLVKLEDISKKFSDKGMNDYATKLKLAYASKASPESGRIIADDIKAAGDVFFEEGSMKDAITTYDTYIELAGNYYDKDAMAGKLMDIAEKFFDKGRYNEAIKYYSLYLSKYGTSPVADYCSYKLALAYYYNKDCVNAINKFEEFLNTYQNSVWFEKGFENLCKLYYENLSVDKAIENLQKLIDAYPRRDTRDYACLLVGILYYNKTDYDKALEVLKKMQQDFPRSSYLYAAQMLIDDINDIKKGAAPSFSFGSKDLYKTWEPYMPVNADIGVTEGAEIVENKEAKAGEIFVKAKPGANIKFSIGGLEDMDRFNEYQQDKEDESRLPKKIREETEKDLVFFTWSGPESGKFLEDKQTLSRTWQAPKEPGNYTISINIGDLGLIRPPDTGSKKDQPKTLTMHVSVEK